MYSCGGARWMDADENWPVPIRKITCRDLRPFRGISTDTVKMLLLGLTNAIYGFNFKS